jgi:hypothetical protein
VGAADILPPSAPVSKLLFQDKLSSRSVFREKLPVIRQLQPVIA